MKNNRQLLTLIFWVALVLFISFLSGKMTQANLEPWYNLLNKSSLTPPAFVFPVVWTALYLMIAVAGWLLWLKKDKRQVRLALNFYAVQLGMNWLWTPFSSHSIYWLLVFSGYSVCVFLLC